jgi:6-phosphogluconolactonase
MGRVPSEVPGLPDFFENPRMTSADLRVPQEFDLKPRISGRTMHMKFNKPAQLLLVSAASLGAACLLIACSQLSATLTVDFVYVASARAAGPDNYGEIDVFEINSESGHMRQIPTSPFPSGGRNPVAEAVSSDYKNLYVVNQDDNTIVQFVIGNDGKLYPQSTVNTPGVFPLAVSVAKSNLYVADTFQPLPTCSPASPCSGSIAVFPILPASGTTPSGTLQTGTPINSCGGLPYVPLIGPVATHVIAPTAVNASSNGSYLFVAGYDTTSSPNVGYVFAFSVGTLSCGNATIPTLTPVAGSPFPAGVHPSAVTSDPSGSYVYLTDYASADIVAYAVGSTLTPVGGSPFPAGNQPSAIAIDATGKLAVVANSLDSSVTSYSLSAGTLNRIGSFGAGLQPVAIGIDPNMNQYVYTANFLGDTVSGFQLQSPSGSLLNTQNSPFTANAQPTAVAAIPHNGSKN